nr:hypothetical protein [Verrucomicrobiales bacterium]
MTLKPQAMRPTRAAAASVTTATTPSVTIAAAASISGSVATLGGNVTADGGWAVCTRRVVYDTTARPSLGGQAAFTPTA